MLNMGFGVKQLLLPENIAIVGPSGDTSKVNLTGVTGVMSNLLKYGYQGNIYPVNPKYDEVFGLKCYPNLNAVPESVDLVIIGVRNDKVLAVVEQAAKSGAKSCIIITSGFGEDKREKNREMQNKLLQLSSNYGMRICGPNCLGIINVHSNIVAMSSVGLLAGPINPGKVALISQSGALSSSFLARAKDKGIGFSYIISSGNEADLDLSDYIHYLVDDPNTKVIAAYIEGIKDAERLKIAAKLCWENNKPLVVFKVGKSLKGSEAVQAHTGSIAGSDEIVNALFEKFNIIRVDSLEDILDIASAFSLNEAVCHGNRLGILTVSGGTGSILSDICQDLGLDVVDLDTNTLTTLEKILPAYTSVKNPVDTTAEILKEPENILLAGKAIETDNNVDAICISLTAAPPAFERKAVAMIIEFKKQCKKPVITTWCSGTMNSEGMKRLQENNVPCFTSHETGLLFIKMLATRHNKSYEKIRAIEKIETDTILIPKIFDEDKMVLNEFDSKKVLQHFGIPTVLEENVKNISDAKKAASSIGYPVAMKINSDDIPHKSEAGCVFINVENEQQLISTYTQLMNNANSYNKNAVIDGVIVQEMVTNARECIVGVKNDAMLGPVVMFGLGGVFVEVLKDVVFKMAPLTEEEAREMIMEIKGAKILNGYRGHPQADIEAIVDILQKVGKMAYSLKGYVKELDINPLMVLDTGKGAKVADALFILNGVDLK